MLSRGALRCIVPVCSVGMVAVVCGGVTWTARIGFSGNAKNVIFGDLCLPTRFQKSSVGMVAVVCGDVTWTAWIGKMRKMSFSGVFCLRFSDDALITACN